MNHARLHQIVQLQVLLWIRNLSRDDLVNVITSTQFVLSPKDDQHVSVWQAPLLELDDVDACHRHS